MATPTIPASRYRAIRPIPKPWEISFEPREGDEVAHVAVVQGGDVAEVRLRANRGCDADERTPMEFRANLDLIVAAPQMAAALRAACRWVDDVVRDARSSATGSASVSVDRCLAIQRTLNAAIERAEGRP